MGLPPLPPAACPTGTPAPPPAHTPAGARSCAAPSAPPAATGSCRPAPPGVPASPVICPSTLSTAWRFRPEGGRQAQIRGTQTPSNKLQPPRSPLSQTLPLVFSPNPSFSPPSPSPSPTRAAAGAVPGLPRCADLPGDVQVPQQVQVPQPGGQLPDPVRSEAEGVQGPQAVHHDGHLRKGGIQLDPVRSS